MNLHAYSIYDRKALQYHPPFFAAADGSAARTFQDLANDPQTTIGRHPSDYVLYRVGGWDDATGILSVDLPPQHVVDALSLVRAQPALFPANPSQPE